MAVPVHNRRVKRWIGAFLAVVLACVPILLHRATSKDLLLDSDTSVLLATIRQRQAPFSWFTGDWPLQNHFYRPVSTLTFELDNWLYGSNSAGYGFTNALICVFCVLLLFWFLREVTDHAVFAASGAVLFAFQHVRYDFNVATWVYYLAELTAIVGFVRHRFKVSLWLPAVLTLLYVMEEITAPAELGERTFGWLPGRTATVMTVFALMAMAAYARYERLGARREEVELRPIDPPATRTTRTGRPERSAGIGWALLSFVAVALALASYEQAVMLPAVMLAIAVTFRFSRFRVRWGWQAGFWALLVAYLVLRKEVLPAGVSHYQAQQFRSGPGVRLSLLGYLLPAANGVSGFLTTLDAGPLMFLTGAPYVFFLSVASNLTALFQARRKWVWALAGYGMSFLAFLPMAWVKQFGHYNYWPIAIRSLFTITILWIGYEMALNAASPPTKQAPPRLDPAPGSLPHP